MESFEHSRLKPLSILAVVEYKTRRILGLSVAQMACKGTLAARSLSKYGPREDHRKKSREELFSNLKPFISATAVLRSDSNPHYPPSVKNHFPLASHQTVISRRAAIVGQGELKGRSFDPIFSFNHTAAMFRAFVSRLFRKTWNTTKKSYCLEAHMLIYAQAHNERLLAKATKPSISTG